MKWHCGLLAEQPNPTLEWVKRGYWHQGLPTDVDRELRIWLSMPGFTTHFHVHTLRVGEVPLRRWHNQFYDQFKAEVAENWLSVTREDAVKLSQLRPPRGDLPLLSKLQLMDDLKRGRRPSDLVAEYQTNSSTVNDLRNGRVALRAPLPPGFELLVPSIT